MRGGSWGWETRRVYIYIEEAKSLLPSAGHLVH